MIGALLALALGQSPIIVGPGGFACPSGQAIQVITGTRDRGRCVAFSSTAPAGTDGNLQVKSGTTLAAYAGTTPCGSGQYMTGLDASGAATCAAGAPTGGHYVTTQAEAGLSAEAVLPTCSGTDKLTFNGSALSCAVDEVAAGVGTATTVYASSDRTLTCNTWTSIISSGSYAASSTVRMHCSVWVVTPATINASNASNSVSGPASPTAVSYSQITWVATTPSNPSILYVGRNAAYDTANAWTGNVAPASTTYYLIVDAVVQVGATPGAISLRARQTCGTGDAITWKAGSYCTFTSN